MKCFSHEIIYSDKKSTFIELLEKDNSVLIDKQNLHFLAIDMLQFKGCLVPALSKEKIPQNRQNRYKLENNAFKNISLGI